MKKIIFDLKKHSLVLYITTRITMKDNIINQFQSEDIIVVDYETDKNLFTCFTREDCDFFYKEKTHIFFCQIDSLKNLKSLTIFDLIIFDEALSIITKINQAKFTQI